MKRKILISAALAAVLFVSVPVMAQSDVYAVSFAQAGATVPTDTGFWSSFPVVDFVNAAVTLLTLVLSWLLVKVVIPKIPNWTIPILAGTVLPWLSTWLVSLAATPDLTWWQASLYGMGATVIHQLYKQLKEGKTVIAARLNGKKDNGAPTGGVA